MNEKTLGDSYEKNIYPLNLSIDELDISIRLYHLLKQNKLLTLSDIIEKGEESVSEIKGYNSYMKKELGQIFKEKKLDYFQSVEQKKEGDEDNIIPKRRVPHF